MILIMFLFYKWYLFFFNLVPNSIAFWHLLVSIVFLYYICYKLLNSCKYYVRVINILIESHQHIIWINFQFVTTYYFPEDAQRRN